MKSVIKKFTACLLALTMVLGMSTVAMAADTASTDTGSITVNGLTEGVTVSAYQIAKATYDADGNFLGYEMTVSSTDTTWQINSDGSWTDPTEADLAALFAALGVNPSASGTAQVDMGATSATITGLSVGSYLIVVTNSDSVVYGMMIGSVSYAVDEETGEWTIDNGSFVVQDCELWAKATTPTIGKTEHHTDGNETHGESTNVGDEITFDIRISPIPSYQGEYPEFEVDDELKGLTITDAELNSITVKIMNGETEVATLVKDTDYTVTKVSDTELNEGVDEEIDINFVVNGKYTLNNYANLGYTIVIEYQATVTDTAEYVQGEAEYDNDATLKYSTNSYASGNEGKSEDKDYEYTFAVNATKTDNSDPAQPLEGATFTLYTDADCSTAYTQNGTAVTATSGSDGTIHFSGLAEGTYYMKETEAATGYLLNDAVYKVDISATYKEDGSIESWTISVTLNGESVGSATNSADTGLTIINTKTGLLPSMGGMGTTLFTIIGLIMVVCALGGVIIYRKRRS